MLILLNIQKRVDKCGSVWYNVLTKNEREVTTMTYYEITAYELAYTEGREEELKEELEKWFEEHPEERL
jgi:hypothetical protein